MTQSSDQWVEQVRNDSIRRLEAIRRMQDELAEVYGEAVTARGLVRVRVNPAGRATHLDLKPAAMHLSAGALSTAILAAIGDATGQASRRMHAVIGEVVPADELSALMGGTVTDSDTGDVREQLAELRVEAEWAGRRPTDG